MSIRTVCVFCGSSPGTGDTYRQTAFEVGKAIAGRGLRLVYGGGSVGLMGAVADGALESGGDVVGIIPHGLADRERMHNGVTTMMRVRTMHDRKRLMAEESDAFVALPGGMGTMEEFTEVFTWGQLGIHRKPFGLLNIAGYFDPFIAFMDHMVSQGFLSEAHRGLVSISDDFEDLYARMEAWEPPEQTIWLHKSET